MGTRLTYRVEARRAGPEVSVGWTRRAELRFDTGVELSDDLFGPAEKMLESGPMTPDSVSRLASPGYHQERAAWAPASHPTGVPASHPASGS